MQGRWVALKAAFAAQLPALEPTEWSGPSLPAPGRALWGFGGDRGAEVLTKPAYSFMFYSLNLGKAV